MAGAYVSATVDIGDVEQGLDAMLRRSRHLEPAFHELKAPVKDDQKDHAAKKSGPETSWPARMPSTIERHPKLARRKLLGRLPTAVRYRVLPQAVIGDSVVAWSLAQQDGARVGHGARLPSRPFLWISDRLLDIAASVISKAMMLAWGGR